MSSQQRSTQLAAECQERASTQRFDPGPCVWGSRVFQNQNTSPMANFCLQLTWPKADGLAGGADYCTTCMCADGSQLSGGKCERAASQIRKAHARRPYFRLDDSTRCTMYILYYHHGTTTVIVIVIVIVIDIDMAIIAMATSIRAPRLPGRVDVEP